MNKYRGQLIEWSLYLSVVWLFIFQPLYYFWNLSWFICSADGSCGFATELGYLLSFFLGYFSELFKDEASPFKFTPGIGQGIGHYWSKEIYLEILQTVGIGILLLFIINKWFSRKGMK